MEGDMSTSWSSLPESMTLTIDEEKKSDIYIAASFDFTGASVNKMTKNHQGSLFYRIEVDGEPVVHYHVSNPRDSKRPLGVSLHAKASLKAGSHTVEVFYKVSKNGSWDLLKYQNQRQLSILTYPKD